MNESIIIIQAAFRGYLTRKKLNLLQTDAMQEYLLLVNDINTSQPVSWKRQSNGIWKQPHFPIQKASKTKYNSQIPCTKKRSAWSTEIHTPIDMFSSQESDINDKGTQYEPQMNPFKKEILELEIEWLKKAISDRKHVTIFIIFYNFYLVFETITFL